MSPRDPASLWRLLSDYEDVQRSIRELTLTKHGYSNIRITWDYREGADTGFVDWNGKTSAVLAEVIGRTLIDYVLLAIEIQEKKRRALRARILVAACQLYDEEKPPEKIYGHPRTGNHLEGQPSPRGRPH